MLLLGSGELLVRELVGVLLFVFEVFLLQPKDGVLCLARALAPLLEGVLVRSREVPSLLENGVIPF